MERSIVHAFKRLRVLTPNFKFRGNMDELVNDLSHALEESSCCQVKSVGGKSRRRRGRKRRSKCNAHSHGMCSSDITSKHRSCFISEDSESSLDLSSVSHQYYSKDKEMITIEHEKLKQNTLSDTDDLNIIQRFRQAINIPYDGEGRNLRKPSSGMSFGESDSVNENFSPVRPHRRRRKFKRMDVDCLPIDEKISNPSSANNSTSIIPSVSDISAISPSNQSSSEFFMLTCGKRKRNSRERSLEILEDDKLEGSGEVSVAENPILSHHHHYICNNESSISSLSSSESDTDLVKRDEGREADDEQSDFFFEPGPACGIPGIKPWEMKRDDTEETDAKFEKILNGCFEHLTSSAQKSYHYSLQRIKNMQKRNIRTGHRRLDTPKRPQSTVTSIDDIILEFLRDPNQNELWLPPLNKKEKEQLLNLASMYMLKIKCEGHGPRKRAFLMKTPTTMEKIDASSEGISNIQNNNVVLNDIKRRKKTPSGLVGEDASPIPEDNIGNKMLRDMGWKPNTGLGIQNRGQISLVPVYRHPKYQGLGHSSSTTTDAPMMS